MSKRIPTGRLYQKSYVDRAGNRRTTDTWYLKFYSHGMPVEKSSGLTDYDEALAMLRKEMAGASAPHVAQPALVKMDQLFDLLIDDYKFNKRSSAGDTELRVAAHLRTFFGDKKATAITSVVLRQFIDHRKRQEAKDATINKELSWVRRAMKLGMENEPQLVSRKPAFKMLRLDNAREGVLEHEEYRAVRDLLPTYARIALVIGYHTGARRGEIRKIRRDRIDLKAKRIQMPGRTTKNGEARYIPIYGEMGAELEMELARPAHGCAYLMHDKGVRVLEFKRSWATACEAAGVDDALFHDLRRTAITNMIEAGFSEKEAMEISGHKTRSVFERYHIVSDRRMKENAEKLGVHLAAKEKAAVEREAEERKRAN
jgi:integrase